MRTFPAQPVVGVGAVVLARGRVLLVKRAHPPLQGEWSVPGGVVELGEGLREAVAREVREETGLDVDVGPVVDVVDCVQASGDGRIEYHYVIVDFLCSALSGDPAPGSDAAAAQWVAVADLARLGVAPMTIDVIHKALELSARTP